MCSPIGVSYKNGGRRRPLRWACSASFPSAVTRWFLSSAVLYWTVMSCLHVRHLCRPQNAEDLKYLRQFFLPRTSTLRCQISLSKCYGANQQDWNARARSRECLSRLLRQATSKKYVYTASLHADKLADFNDGVFFESSTSSSASVNLNSAL